MLLSRSKVDALYIRFLETTVTISTQQRDSYTDSSGGPPQLSSHSTGRAVSPQKHLPGLG